MSRRTVTPADVVLGELTAEQRAQADLLLRDDARFRSAVLDLQRVAARLDDLPPAAWDGPPAAPALDLDAALAARPARERRRLRLPVIPQPRGALRLTPVAAGACAAVLLGAGVAGGLLAGGGERTVTRTVAAVPPLTQSVALRPLGDRRPGEQATVRMSGGANGEMEFDGAGLPPTPAGEVYQLWLLNSPGDLVSVGTFRVGADGRAVARFHVGVDPSRFRFVDVSVQRQHGGAAHSGDSLLRSPALS